MEQEFKIGDRVTVYNRYLFAVPVHGYVDDIAPDDEALSVIFDAGQNGKHNVTDRNGTYFFPHECRHAAPPPHANDDNMKSFHEIYIKVKEDVIREQAAVIDTLREMVKVQGELIELLRKAQA